MVERARIAASPVPGTPPAAPLHNAEIGAALDEIADSLEISGANPFRVRAYHNAARIVATFPEEVASLLARGGTLKGIRGIGEDLAGKIADLALTGSTPLLSQVRSEVPSALGELLRLPGLGPKRLGTLHRELGIETLGQLRRALKEDRVAGLPGFGKKITANLLQTVEARDAAPPRMQRALAAQYAEPLAAWLKSLPGVSEADVAGSYRRASDTVGDLDLVAAAIDTATVIERFIRYPEIERFLAKGPTRATVLLRCGLQVDIRVVRPESYGAALAYSTGGRAHALAIRKLARERGLKINEYGVFRGGRRIAGRSEKEVYAALGLPLIPPELRENQGEIEAAFAGRLPHLVDPGDIRGDLHVHTLATDGRNSLHEMVDAARAKGYDYVAITDHSRRLTVAHGLDPVQLRQQMREIDTFNRRHRDIHVLKGVEVDILEDGSLDLPDDVLAELDIVIGAIHSGFGLSRAAQTKRLLRALDHPLLTVLAHPSGRLIGERKPYELDFDRVLLRARQMGKFLELDSQPDRLDLTDAQCRHAKELGIKVSISSDAHSVAELELMHLGVGQARRGWLEKGDVINSRSLAELKRLIEDGRRDARSARAISPSPTATARTDMSTPQRRQNPRGRGAGPPVGLRHLTKE